jgi:SAM-dependent methyltransferase
MNKEISTKEYWQKNIEAFGKFYDKNSEEQIIASGLVNIFYKTIVFPWEKRIVLKRYRKVVSFIDKNIRPGMKVIDLGCGTGIFTTELLLRGAHVLAIDFAETALAATKKRVVEMLPEKQNNVEYLLLDITEKPLPKSDIVMAIGVAPYVDSLETFLGNILPTTNRLYCFLHNKRNWLNRLRQIAPFLNVRRIRFFDEQLWSDLLGKYYFKRVSRENLGVSILDDIQRMEKLDDREPRESK